MTNTPQNRGGVDGFAARSSPPPDHGITPIRRCKPPTRTRRLSACHVWEGVTCRHWEEIMDMSGLFKGNNAPAVLAAPLFAALLLALSPPSHAQTAGFGGDQLRCYEKCQNACGEGATEAAFKKCVNANDIQWHKGCTGPLSNGDWNPFYAVMDKAALIHTDRGAILQYRCTENQTRSRELAFKTPRQLCADYMHLIVNRDHQACLKNVPACRKKC